MVIRQLHLSEYFYSQLNTIDPQITVTEGRAQTSVIKKKISPEHSDGQPG